MVTGTTHQRFRQRRTLAYRPTNATRLQRLRNALNPETALRFGLRVAGAALFTTIVIQYSLRYGRLLIYPAYDDVAYLLDGLRRLDGFYREGPLNFFLEWAKNPPHSPLSTLLAFAGFLFFGVHDWAPYVANGLLIAMLIGFTDLLMKPVSRLFRFAAIVFVLSTPIAIETVFEFRPDLAAGMFTTFAIFVLLDDALIERPDVRGLVSGSLIGLALLSKPTVFPFTILISLGTILCVFVRDWMLESPDERTIVRRLAVILLPVLAIAGPHYVVGTRQVLAYIYTGQFRYADVWSLKGSLNQHIAYYLNGEGARIMLGSHRYILLAIFLLGSVYFAFTRRREEIISVAPYAVVVFMAYLFPTLNWVKSQFFGVVFHFLVIFSALLVLRHFAVVERKQSEARAASVLMVLVALIGIVCFQWPTFMQVSEIPLAQQRKQISDRIIAAIASHADGNAANVMLTTTGYVNCDLLNYLSLRRKLSLKFTDLAFAKGVEQHEKTWHAVDFVVAAEADNSESVGYVPSYAIQDQLLASLRSLPEFALIDTVPTLNGKSFFVFENLRRVGHR